MQEHIVNINVIYNKALRKKLLFIFAGLAFLLFLIIWSVSLGTADISIHDIFASIFGRILPFVGIETSSFSNTIVWELRLPRIFMAIIGGMGFALAGAAMQGIMRNPLVSPFTIGISSAAGFGASIAIVLSVGIINVPKYLIIGNAFLFAVLAAFLVYGIARLRGINSETLIRILLNNSHDFFSLFSPCVPTQHKRKKKSIVIKQK